MHRQHHKGGFSARCRVVGNSHHGPRRRGRGDAVTVWNANAGEAAQAPVFSPG